MSEWYENLKPGDLVEVQRGGVYQGSVIDTVERLTPTLIVLESGLRFKRINGLEYGGSEWNGNYLRQMTQERIERIEAGNLAYRIRIKISKVDWSKVPLSTLRDISDKLDELNGEQKS